MVFSAFFCTTCDMTHDVRVSWLMTCVWPDSLTYSVSTCKTCPVNSISDAGQDECACMPGLYACRHVCVAGLLHVCVREREWELTHGRVWHTIGWRKHIGSLIFIGHFPQKWPTFSGSFVENNLQLRGCYESSPPCTMGSSQCAGSLICENSLWMDSYFCKALVQRRRDFWRQKIIF